MRGMLSFLTATVVLVSGMTIAPPAFAQGGALAGQVLQQEMRRMELQRHAPYLFRPVTAEDLGMPAGPVIEWEDRLPPNNLVLAQRRFHDGKYAEAVEAAGSYLTENPDSTEAFLVRGASSFYLRNFDAAYADSNRAVALNASSDDAYLLRGVSALALGNSPEAKRDAARALEINPDSPKAHALQAAVSLIEGDIEASRRNIDQALSLDDELPAAYVLRGLLNLNQEDYAQAIRDSKKAIKLNPDLAMPYLVMGNARLKQGQVDEALKDSRAALKVDEESAFAYVLQGDALAAKGGHSVDEARDNYRQAIRFFQERGNAARAGEVRKKLEALSAGSGG